ncbi:hypothetical protein GGF32_002973 [Allomyces javanicus]|nr:hypothetical protein GGF32_002973 [Allomyces javanicus]
MLEDVKRADGFPETLTKVTLKIYTSGPGYFAATAPKSIPESAKVQLSTLRLLDVPMEIATVQKCILGCFSLYLTPIKIAFSEAPKVGPIIHKFVQRTTATCKQLRKLHMGTYEAMSIRQLVRFAHRTMPLLQALPIEDFGLLTFGLDDSRGTEAVLIALISCVPNVDI